ncbi:MAG: Guanine/hypoxanthine permease PbuG [bacterium ADurb.Bin478]|nr:MAG: Guanine/hypoxanthine permease PbuG [bacterium ADurb.Bin478]
MIRKGLDHFFKLSDHGTTIHTEGMAGLTTFITMAYIIFVNPAVLSATGMDRGAVFTATILATVIATLIMGLYANVPFAQAPGMGLNSFFTFTVVLTMGFSWQQALAIVFLCGVINFIIVVTRVRKLLIQAIPESLQHAIGGGIGLFIAYIGFKNAHFLDFIVQGNNVVHADLQDGRVVELVSRDVLPALAHFNDPTTLLALAGILVTVVMLLLRWRGALLLGILFTTAIGLLTGMVAWPQFRVQDFLPPSLAPTLFKLDLAGLFNRPDQLFSILTVIVAFSLSDTFDTIGTFIGAGRKAGIFDQSDEAQLKTGRGFSSKMDRALFSDGIATSLGALLGTSNVTSYVESAAGISAGGRTGLTSVFTAFLFLLCLFIAPLAMVIPVSATAAALIVVGILMIECLRQVAWNDIDQAVAAFFTVVMMPFTFSIANGVAAGFIFYVLTKVVRRQWRSVHPLMYIVTGLFLFNFIISAFH